MNTKSIPGAASAVYALLEPFSEQERLNVVRAALALFGQSLAVTPAASRSIESDGGGAEFDGIELPQKAARWAQQFGLTSEMLESVFFLEPSPPEVVASIPGTTAQEKTVSCYLLTGVAAFLKSGEAQFDDATARALCEHAGCYDPTNHSKRIKHFGNRIAGSKAKGWKMLAPGLKDAASLVKEIATKYD